MKLIEFSVTNYRSITTAHKIPLQNLTVLVGKNNEGKSNLLTALNVAMNAVIMHSRLRDGQVVLDSRYSYAFNWNRDFPIQYQDRRSGLESIFKLNFRLEGDELNEFHSKTGIRGNEDIPICVKIGKDNKPKVEVPKRGSSSYNRKSREVTEFISQRISVNYIQAVRTAGMAISALQNAIYSELESLKENPEYIEAVQKVNSLQQEVLNQIAAQLQEPLKTFLPNLAEVSIKKDNEDFVPRYLRNDIDVILNDGIATSISNKGDGIKSLVTLAILKDKQYFNGASVIAIEEPESHLHSGAIHSIVNVINKMSENNQVIITTHNPLFVQQNKLSSNIIVDQGTARQAKTISEIRNILGVWPSDNLKNSRFVLVVEGEDDKISLSKILPAYSRNIKQALQSNQLVIKSLGGASNLSHDLSDLKNTMCNYVVLLDNDAAGISAAERAINNGLLTEAIIKYTICNGMPESEFEDCLKPNIYKEIIQIDYGVNINSPEFRGHEKWSERVKKTFLSQGSRWTETIEKKVKLSVAQSIPDSLTQDDLYDVIIQQKSGFINGLVAAIDSMISE